MQYISKAATINGCKGDRLVYISIAFIHFFSIFQSSVKNRSSSYTLFSKMSVLG